METFIHSTDFGFNETDSLEDLASYNFTSTTNVTYGDANITDDAITATISTGNETFGNDTELADAPYFALPYQVVGCLFVSIIFVVGLVGNVMVVIVVLRTRSMHTPTNCYLVSLAIADVLLLISAPLPTIVEYFLIIDQFVLGPVGCALMVFTQYLGINVSSLSITAFTIERYIAICHPMKAQTMCTVRRAKRIIVGLWAFGLCYCAPWLGLTTTYVKTFRGGVRIEVCTFKLERDSYLTYYMADLVIFYVVPLLLTCILYGLIARILSSSTLSATPGKPTVANGSETSNKNKKRPSSSRIQMNFTNRKKQVIKMLAIVVGMFAVLWMPYRVYVVYNSFASVRYTDFWFLLLTRVMVYMNSAINPILYNAMSVKFRRAFKRLLYCGKKGESAYYSHFTQVTQVNAYEMR